MRFEKYMKTKNKALSGKQANAMCLQLQKGAKVDKEEIGERLKRYEYGLQKQMDKISQIRQHCFLLEHVLTIRHRSKWKGQYLNYKSKNKNKRMLKLIIENKLTHK